MRLLALHLAQYLAWRIGFGAVLILFMGWFYAGNLLAHNVDQRMNWMALDDVTRAMIKERAAAGDFPLLRANDELGIVIKASPEPSGATVGVGGYLTFYPPEGVQITGASYVIRDGTGGFLDIPLKGQAIIAVGDGSVGGKDTEDLIGLTLGPNAVGQTEDAVDEEGLHRGTLAGLYGDTGIFYAVNPDTAWQSWSGGPMKNNRGEEITPTNTWDADQLRAYGWKDESPIIDPDGRGSTPWGMGSPVAGPQSGYAWQFDGAIWDASAKTAVDLRASITLGPWIRMQYPGSQVAVDQPGLESTDLGYAGVATELGTVVDAANPLPATTDLTDDTSPKAVRWSVGMLQAGNFEYVRVWVKILADAGDPDSPFDANGCFEAFADVGGGDAGGEQGGKDHPWRYYDPTYAALNPGSVLTVQGSKDVVQNGKLFKYDIEYVNASAVTMTNVVITQTLPGKVELISSTPAQESGPNPMRWSVASLAPGEKFTATVNVRAESSGELVVSRVEATNAQGCPALVEEGTWLGENPVLVPSVSAMPSNAAPGDTIQYTLRVDNTGAGPSGNELIITDSLAEHFTFVGLDSVRINGGNTINQTTVDASDPRRPFFIVERAIPKETYLELKFTAQVAANAPSGTYYNTFGISHRDPVLGKDVTIASGPQAPVIIGVAALGDTVFRDWNGNGVYDPEDEGIAGVTLQLDSGHAGTTNAGGNYLFNNLPAGTFEIDVTDAGGVLSGYTLTSGADPLSVALESGEERLDIHFGFQPGGSGSIQGLVFDDKGNDGQFNGGMGDEGITGITVRLYEDTNGDGIVDADEDALVATTASASGSYSFNGLALGISYVVDVDDADVTTYFASSEWVNATIEPRAISNLAGSVSDIDFGYYLVVPGSISGSVFRDANRNGTQDDIEQGLVALTLRLYQDRNGNAGLDSGEPLLQTTQSSGDGSYAFFDLAAGDYVIDLDQSTRIPEGHQLNGSDPLALSLFNSENAIGIDFPFDYEDAGVLSQTVDRLAARPGDALTYSFDVEVDADDLIGAVNVSSPIPSGTTYIPASANASGSKIGDAVAWNFGSAVPGSIGRIPNLGRTTVISSISQGSDDVEEAGGIIYTLSTDLDLGQEDGSLLGGEELIGLRFQNIQVSAGETIRRAYIRFRALENDTSAADLTIQAQAADDAEAFTLLDSVLSVDLSTRPTTTGSANWVPDPWTAGNDYDTPDLSAIVQETVDRGGWSSGNSMVFIITGTGTRAAEAFDHGGNNEPQLVIEYGGIDYSTIEDSTVSINSVTQSNDDVEEVGTEDSSIIYSISEDLELGQEGETLIGDGEFVGLRFQNIQIPPGETVDRAYIRFRAIEPDLLSNNSDPANLTVHGEAADDAEAFTTLNNVASVDVSARSRTSASVDWIPSSWTTGQYYDTPDLSRIVEETAGRPGWSLGNSMVFIITGTGSRSAEAFDHLGGSQPQLVIEYGAVDWLTNEISLVEPVVPSGRQVTVKQELTAVSTVDDVTPALSVSGTNGAAATLVSGPSPASSTVGPEGASFLWVYEVTSAVDVEQLTFSGDATAGAVTWPTASSNGLIVVPPLSFQVAVNDPPGVAQIENTGNFEVNDASSGTVIPTTNSNTVVTWLTGSVLGDLVWVDLNGDGVRDRNEAGLSGVEVCATDGTNTFCETTDADGVYLITGLDAGSWMVSINLATVPAGYLPTTSPAVSLVLADAETNTTADFGMEPPGDAAISGAGKSVWIDADADGVPDSNELGLGGVTINLHRDKNANGLVDSLDVLVASTMTHSDGDYAFTGLPAGNYLVAVDEDSGVSTGYGVSTMIGSAMNLVSGNNPHAVMLPAGSIYTDANFGYQWGGTIGDMVWYDLNGNGVHEASPPDGGGIEEVALLLYYDTDGDGSKAATDPIVAFTLTNSVGNYQFNNLPPGTYVVDIDESTVPAPPSSANAGDYDLVVSTTGDNRAVSLLPKENHTNADFGWIEAGTVGDVVFRDSNSNGVRDSGEAGLPDIRVDLNGTDLAGRSLTRVAVTDLNGGYSFLVPPGSYAVSYDTTDSDIPASLTVPTTPTSISAQISSGSAFADADFGRGEGGTIQGAVFSDVDGDGIQDFGEPGLSGITTYLYRAGGGSALAVNVTDAQGIYQFNGAEDGGYIVEVDLSTIPSAYSATADPDESGACVVCDGEGTVTITAGNTILGVDFGFQRPGPLFGISGVVYDDVDGNGMRDSVLVEGGLESVAVIADCGGDGRFVSVTDAAGNWSVLDIPSGGSCDVSVDKATLPNIGYEVTTAPVITVSNITSNVIDQDFGYELVSAAVEGRVVEGNGDGIADAGESGLFGVTVTVKHPGSDGILGSEDDVIQSMVTDGDGQYSFAGIPEGSIQIVETDLPDYVSLADADGGNPNVISQASHRQGMKWEDRGEKNDWTAALSSATRQSV